jgi:menaquinone-dependent protoporphyrinogen oxidase
MKVLVAYASALGATGGIAERIGETLRAQDLEVEVLPAGQVVESFEPVSFDAFVIGSAVHGGHWLDEAVEFVRLHAPLLAQRPVWLFSSGPVGEKYVNLEQPEPKEMAELRRLLNPRAHHVFAGAFDRHSTVLGKLGFVERTAVKAFMPEGDFRDWKLIEAWAREIAAELETAPVG